MAAGDYNEITESEVTGNHVGDAPMLPELLDQVPDDQEIGMVTADGAYDTRACHNAVANRGAHAVIPTRRNAKPWKPLSWFAGKPLPGSGQRPGRKRAMKS